ncbi:alpha/beta hydrolase [Chitinophaga sedimenti]|uniref:alpha/beta hydrolase fold domain-containing protein n=1 Tax=Chitinophaga sedimenti TaxID=2033606 RepID=UPI00200330FC|nr:alpha/beta hydrolase [Chitinophaga sedimenti]MCK7557477.1 alpha/beta hydrolase [Chitinophaga sedimenti]
MERPGELDFPGYFFKFNDDAETFDAGPVAPGPGYYGAGQTCNLRRKRHGAIPDIYTPKKANGMSVLFMHGGGFESGHPENQKMFGDSLAARGFKVFVMSYRLYLKGVGFGCNIPTPEKLKAIRIAVEDAADAGQYIVEHAKELGVDPKKLYISGSSAGAEAILHLVFNPFEKADAKRYAFYKDYRFAGAMAFAGAHIDLNCIRKDNFIPLLLLHGDNDQLVPFGTAPHRFCNATQPGWMMFFGAQPIFEKAKALGMPALFYSFAGKGHEISWYMFTHY